MSVGTNYPPQPTVVVYTQTAWSRFWSWVGWAGFVIVGLIVLFQWVALADYFDTSVAARPECEIRPIDWRACLR